MSKRTPITRQKVKELCKDWFHTLAVEKQEKFISEGIDLWDIISKLGGKPHEGKWDGMESCCRPNDELIRATTRLGYIPNSKTDNWGVKKVQADAATSVQPSAAKVETEDQNCEECDDSADEACDEECAICKIKLTPANAFVCSEVQQSEGILSIKAVETKKNEEDVDYLFHPDQVKPLFDQLKATMSSEGSQEEGDGENVQAATVMQSQSLLKNMKAMAKKGLDKLKGKDKKTSDEDQVQQSEGFMADNYKRSYATYMYTVGNRVMSVKGCMQGHTGTIIGVREGGRYVVQYDDPNCTNSEIATHIISSETVSHYEITLIPRFAVGTKVMANVEDYHQWMPGTIIKIGYQEEATYPYTAVYKILLDSGVKVYSMTDSDDEVRKMPLSLQVEPSHAMPSHDNRRFRVHDRVKARIGGKPMWRNATVTALNYTEPSSVFDQGFVAPYQVQLDSGELYYVPKDTNHYVTAMSYSSINPSNAEAETDDTDETDAKPDNTDPTETACASDDTSECKINASNAFLRCDPATGNCNNPGPEPQPYPPMYATGPMSAPPMNGNPAMAPPNFAPPPAVQNYMQQPNHINYGPVPPHVTFAPPSATANTYGSVYPGMQQTPASFPHGTMRYYA